MDINILLWLLGGFATLTLGLLSLIWSELRSMRMGISALNMNSTRHETIIESLPCRRGLPCIPERRAE